MRDLNLQEKNKLNEILSNHGLEKEYPLRDFRVRLHTNPDATQVEYFKISGTTQDFDGATLKESVVFLGDADIRKKSVVGYCAIIGDYVVIDNNAIVNGLSYVVNDAHVKSTDHIAVGAVFDDEVTAA